MEPPRRAGAQAAVEAQLLREDRMELMAYTALCQLREEVPVEPAVLRDARLHLRRQLGLEPAAT